MHVECLRHRRDGLADFDDIASDIFLILPQFGLSAECNTACLSFFTALMGSGQNQRPLKLCNAAKHGHDHLPRWGDCISPRFINRLYASVFLPINVSAMRSSSSVDLVGRSRDVTTTMSFARICSSTASSAGRCFLAPEVFSSKKSSQPVSASLISDFPAFGHLWTPSRILPYMILLL